MSTPSDTFSYLTNIIGARYALVAALSWLVYDYVLCLGLEVKYVWNSPWGFPKFLYIWTRYFGLLLMILMVLSFQLSSKTPSLCVVLRLSFPFATHSSRCVAFFNLTFWGGVWMMGTVSLILLLRIYAMYERSRSVLIFSLVIYGAHIIVACGLLGTQAMTRYTPPGPLGQYSIAGCSMDQSAPIMVIYWIARLIFDSILLVMVGYKMTHRYVSYNKTDILDIMIKDNVTTFIFIFCVQSVNLFTYRLAPTELASAGMPFSVATDIIMSTRLILHIREAFFGNGEELDASVVKDVTSIPLSPLRQRSQAFSAVASRGVSSRRAPRRRASASYMTDTNFDMDDEEDGIPVAESNDHAGVVVTVEISTDVNPHRNSTSGFGRQHPTSGSDDSVSDGKGIGRRMPL